MTGSCIFGPLRATSVSPDPRRVLGIPALYRLSQVLAAGTAAAPRLVEEFIRPRPGDRMLDIGCGTGDIVNLLPNGVKYTGIDPDERYVAAARRRFGSIAHFAVPCVSSDVADGSEPYDLVTVIGVLHHLADADAEALFALASRALRPGGRIVTCDGAFVAGQSTMARWLLRCDRGRYVRTPDAYRKIAAHHFAEPRVRVIRDLLRIPYTHCIIEAESGTG